MHFVLGKFLGGLFISTIAFTLFYLLYLTVIFTKGEGAAMALVFQVYLFSVLLLAFLSALSILLSLFLTVSANVTITLLLYFLMQWYNGMLKDAIVFSGERISYFYGALYYILPHFEFYDIRIRLVHMWDPLPLWAVVTVCAYTVIYVSFIIWASGVLFKRKSL